MKASTHAILGSASGCLAAGASRIARSQRTGQPAPPVGVKGWRHQHTVQRASVTLTSYHVSTAASASDIWSTGELAAREEGPVQGPEGSRPAPLVLLRPSSQRRPQQATEPADSLPRGRKGDDDGSAEYGRGGNVGVGAEGGGPAADSVRSQSPSRAQHRPGDSRRVVLMRATGKAALAGSGSSNSTTTAFYEEWPPSSSLPQRQGGAHTGATAAARAAAATAVGGRAPHPQVAAAVAVAAAQSLPLQLRSRPRPQSSSQSLWVELEEAGGQGSKAGRSESDGGGMGTAYAVPRLPGWAPGAVPAGSELARRPWREGLAPPQPPVAEGAAMGMGPGPAGFLSSSGNGAAADATAATGGSSVIGGGWRDAHGAGGRSDGRGAKVDLYGAINRCRSWRELRDLQRSYGGQLLPGHMAALMAATAKLLTAAAQLSGGSARGAAEDLRRRRGPASELVKYEDGDDDVAAALSYMWELAGSVLRLARAHDLPPRSLSTALWAVAKIPWSDLPSVLPFTPTAAATGAGGSCGEGDAAAPPPAPRRPLQQLSWVDWQRWSLEMLRCCPPVFESFSPHDFSQALWAAATLECEPLPAGFVPAFLAATHPRLAAFGPQALSNTLWAITKLRFQPPTAWLAAACSAAQPQLAAFTPQALANTAAALAHLEHLPPPNWSRAFLGCCEELWRRMAAEEQAAAGQRALAAGWEAAAEASAAHSLAQISWAVARMGLRVGPEWVEALAAAAAREAAAGRMKGQDVAQVLWALGTLGWDVRRSSDSSAAGSSAGPASSAANATRSGLPAASSAAEGLQSPPATLDSGRSNGVCPPADVVMGLGAEAGPPASAGVSAQSRGGAVGGISAGSSAARLRLLLRAWWRCMERGDSSSRDDGKSDSEGDGARGRSPLGAGMETQQLSACLVACVRLGLVVESNGPSAAAAASESGSGALAAVEPGTGGRTVVPAALIERTLEQLQQRLDEASGQCMANTLWAVTYLGCKPGSEWMAAAVARFLDCLDEHDAGPQETANVWWALGRLRWVPSPEEVHQLLSRSLEFAAAGDFHSGEMAAMLWGIARLGLKLPQPLLNRLVAILRHSAREESGLDAAATAAAAGAAVGGKGAVPAAALSRLSSRAAEESIAEVSPRTLTTMMRAFSATFATSQRSTTQALLERTLRNLWQRLTEVPGAEPPSWGRRRRRGPLATAAAAPSHVVERAAAARQVALILHSAVEMGFVLDSMAAVETAVKAELAEEQRESSEQYLEHKLRLADSRRTRVPPLRVLPAVHLRRSNRGLAGAVIGAAWAVIPAANAADLTLILWSLAVMRASVPRILLEAALLRAGQLCGGGGGAGLRVGAAADGAADAATGELALALSAMGRLLQIVVRRKQDEAVVEEAAEAREAAAVGPKGRFRTLCAAKRAAASAAAAAEAAVLKSWSAAAEAQPELAAARDALLAAAADAVCAPAARRRMDAVQTRHLIQGLSWLRLRPGPELRRGLLLAVVRCQEGLSECQLAWCLRQLVWVGAEMDPRVGAVLLGRMRASLSAGSWRGRDTTPEARGACVAVAVLVALGVVRQAGWRGPWDVPGGAGRDGGGHAALAQTEGEAAGWDTVSERGVKVLWWAAMQKDPRVTARIGRLLRQFRSEHEALLREEEAGIGSEVHGRGRWDGREG